MGFGELSIEQVIEYLEQYPPDKVLPRGFNSPHSYRGFYEELGVEWAENVSIGAMIACLKEAIGRVYTGWKGGDFKMDTWSDVFICDQYGHTGEPVTRWMLHCLIHGLQPEFWYCWGDEKWKRGKEAGT